MTEFVRWSADTITRSGHLREYKPSSAAEECSNIYKLDIEHFLKHKNSCMFIREAAPNEFENGFDLAMKINLIELYQKRPKLWVFCFGDETQHFSTPVYAGWHFFGVRTCRGLMFADTVNDRATRLLLSEMNDRGGLDSEAAFSWRQKWIKAIDDYKQMLSPSKESVIH